MWQRFRQGIVQTLDELFPQQTVCGVADVPDTAPGEWQPDGHDAYCPRCGATADQASVTPRGCPHCVDMKLPWERLTRLSGYVRPMDEWVRQMKFHRQWTWAPWLGGQLAQVIERQPAERQVVVCPVPMHWRRRWSRGYNQAALMARTLARERSWTYLDLLRRTAHRPPQTNIVPSQRHANVRGSISIATVDLAGHDVMLVDDVKTSGATLSLCSRLLKQHNARSVHCVVAAVAQSKQ